ncbi:MAG: IMP cyclohydrolase [Syntrophobacterales bacterium]|jgi:phosphoribosylaminoimidazolecarboxamide formyltransferase/IMP cyclohydrolase|nr:IMP cyclohydrolase [Syntrophobacterales bacterium]
MKRISRAVLSVTDKSGLVEFAKFLAEHQVEILSTGGTAKLLRENGVPVMEVSDFTGFPEMLDGRVKTLHPKIHGGILGRRDLASHQEQMAAHGIKPIDLVVVNLYQFEKAVAKPGCTLDDAIENIDIGGPTMLRAAAKNYQAVTVVVDPADYPLIMSEMKLGKGATNVATRYNLAAKVFKLTHEYDGAIYRYLTEKGPAC